MATHYGLILLAIVFTTPPLRAILKRFVYQPGEGPASDAADKDTIKFEGVGVPDVEGGATAQAHCRAWYSGSMYKRKCIPHSSSKRKHVCQRVREGERGRDPYFA